MFEHARCFYPPFFLHVVILWEGGMIRLKPSSSSNFSIRAFRAQICQFKFFRAYPLTEIRQAVPCRAIRGKTSESRQQYLSQQYPPSLLSFHTEVNSVPAGVRWCRVARAPALGGTTRNTTAYKHYRHINN